jgi:iron(III) transport system substrate-binding protein
MRFESCRRAFCVTWYLILLLAACRAPSSPGDGTREAQENSPDQGELVVYSGRSESLVQPILDQFEAQSGIDVQVRYGSTGELAATLLEEGANSPADVFYAQDPGGLGALERAGMLAELPTELTSRLPQRFTSEDNRWLGISGRARVVVYNTDRLSSEELPTDLWGFTDPEWKGRIGWAPTNGSFQAMVTAMRAFWGQERTRQWLELMKANEPVPYESNTPIVAAVGAGEIDVGFANHYYLYRFLEEGEAFPADNYFLPGGGPGSLLMVSGAGILATAPNKENALLLIEFMISEEAQQYFAGETREYPVLEEVAVPAPT